MEFNGTLYSLRHESGPTAKATTFEIWIVGEFVIALNGGGWGVFMPGQSFDSVLTNSLDRLPSDVAQNSG